MTKPPDENYPDAPKSLLIYDVKRGMGKTEHKAALSALYVMIAIISACGSVPDVIFSDDAGVRDGAAERGDARAQDASATDARSDSKETTNRCPDSPPSGGVCCGTVPCMGCTTSSCEMCAQKTCDGTEVCCATQGNAVVCRSPQGC